jgi:hypothetical protein
VLIFLAEQAPFVKSLARRPGWSSIRGVRAGHFCFIDEPDIRRSIMFIDGLAKLHSCLFRQGSKRSTTVNGAQVNRQFLRVLIIAAALLAVILIGLSIGPVRSRFWKCPRPTKRLYLTCACRASFGIFSWRRFGARRRDLSRAISQSHCRQLFARCLLGASLGAAAAIVLKLTSPLANFAAVSFFAFVGSLGASLWYSISAGAMANSRSSPAALGLGRRPFLSSLVAIFMLMAGEELKALIFFFLGGFSSSSWDTTWVSISCIPLAF